MMRVALLGFTVSDGENTAIQRSDKRPSIQTHVFAHALVDSIHSAGANVDLISTPPISNYPGNPGVIVRSSWRTVDGLACCYLGFINIVILKHITRLLACFVHATKALRAWRSDILLVHGVHTPFLWYSLFIRRRLGLKVVVVLTDPPGVVLPNDRLPIRYLKRLDARLVRLALGNVDGVVSLTQDLADEFAEGRPRLLMEAIHSTSAHVPPVRSHRDTTVLLYAGGLSEANGVDRLAEAVTALDAASIELILLGGGELHAPLTQLASRVPAVMPPALLDRSEVLKMYSTADLLIQPRPVNQSFTRFSFPSKLIEYMASGTPVLSTRLPGIPAEYEPYLYWIEDDSATGIQRGIIKTLATPVQERRKKGESAATFVTQTRSVHRQGRRLRQFLESV